MKISVIIPVLNEEDSIATLLDALQAQSRKPDEIVITDGGSTDGTVSIITGYQERGIPVELVRDANALPGRGRNLAAARAKNEWLAFVDAGIKPDPDWLERLEERALSKPGVEVVYGSWAPVLDSFFRECAAIAYVPPPALHDEVLIRPRSITCCLMQTVAWRSVGGFPEHLRSAEDLLFMQQVEDAGFATGYAPAARVAWNIQGTLGGTFRRFSIYSRNNIRAGLWRSWQRTIFIRYGLLLLVTLAATFAGWQWLSVPIVILLGSLMARSLVAVYRNRAVYPAGAGRNVLRVAMLCPLLFVLDLAAMRGTFVWLVKDRATAETATAGAQNGA